MRYIAHIVTCQYCKEKFDRDKERYSLVSKMRYAHAKCAIEHAKAIKPYIEPEIITPEIKHVCIYCKKTVSESDPDFIAVSDCRFAHKTCYDKEQTREKTSEEKLNIYINNLYKTSFVPPRIQKQINEYVSDYKYTYSGIQRTLTYCYEVKRLPFDIKQDSIGIVPYLYQEAYNYYYTLWEIQQKNLPKVAKIQEYIPKKKVVEIFAPQRNINKRPLFTFLDDEEE